MTNNQTCQWVTTLIVFANTSYEEHRKKELKKKINKKKNTIPPGT